MCVYIYEGGRESVCMCIHMRGGGENIYIYEGGGVYIHTHIYWGERNILVWGEGGVYSTGGSHLLLGRGPPAPHVSVLHPAVLALAEAVHGRLVVAVAPGALRRVTPRHLRPVSAPVRAATPSRPHTGTQRRRPHQSRAGTSGGRGRGRNHIGRPIAAREGRRVAGSDRGDVTNTSRRTCSNSSNLERWGGAGRGRAGNEP